MARTYASGDGPDGGPCFLISETARPCPGVALILNTVIDCTPDEHRMPPVTIDFVNNLPPQHGAAATQVATRFTCNSGDFVLLSQLQQVEEMATAAGLPRDCAPSLNTFFHISAANAANSFYKAVAITVEAGSPGSVVEDEDEDEDEGVPPGAAAGECPICFKEYVVGGATSVKLQCGHTFHSRCLDRWTSVKRTCPYCRAPVPEEDDMEGAEQDDMEGAEQDYGAEHDGGNLQSPAEEEHRTFLVPGGGTPSADAVSGSQPRSPDACCG